MRGRNLGSCELRTCNQTFLKKRIYDNRSFSQKSLYIYKTNSKKAAVSGLERIKVQKRINISYLNPLLNLSDMDKLKLRFSETATNILMLTIFSS